METSLQIFSNNLENNLSEKIVNKIKNGQWNDILANLCCIKENTIILDFIYFKHFAHNNTYDMILNYIITNINNILLQYSDFDVHVNLKNLTIIDIDKHKLFIQNISSLLKDKYPQKLSKCYVYNAPFVFAQFLNIVSIFIDKDTLRKIQLVSSK
jgi:hypothetical protein